MTKSQTLDVDFLNIILYNIDIDLVESIFNKLN